MTVRKLTLIAVLIAGPAAAVADTAPLTQGLVWTRFPSDRALAPYTPEVAFSSRQPGWAVVNCAVDGNGALSDCQVVKESQRRLFFGEAAKRAARVGLFTLAPRTSDDQPTAGARVRFAVVFRLAGSGLKPMPPVEG